MRNAVQQIGDLVLPYAELFDPSRLRGN